MRSWEDVVLLASKQALRQWLENVRANVCPSLEDRVRVQLKTKVRIDSKDSSLASVMKQVLRYIDTQEYDPWDALYRFRHDGLRGKKAEAWEWEYAALTAGEIPILGIGNCTQEEAVQYACGDADMTGQVHTALLARRDGLFQIQEGDRDA